MKNAMGLKRSNTNANYTIGGRRSVKNERCTTVSKKNGEKDNVINSKDGVQD